MKDALWFAALTLLIAVALGFFVVRVRECDRVGGRYLASEAVCVSADVVVSR